MVKINPCGFCGDEIKPEDDCVLVGFASNFGAPIAGHRACAETALKTQGPKNPAKVVTLD